MKKILCVLLTICLLTPCFFCAVSAADEGWTMPRDYYVYPNHVLPFQPKDNYFSVQNSPTFTWPCIYDATYELVVANDEALKDVAYRKDGLTVNMYTFSHTLETGKEYYWRVRYKLNGNYSDWSDARRFYIDENAYEYTVPDTTDFSALLPQHPIFFSSEDLAGFKKVDQTSEEFLAFKKTADADAGRGTLEELVITNPNSTTTVNQYAAPGKEISRAAFMYAITGDDKYKQHAVNGLDEVKDFDPAKLFEFNSNTDTAETIFIYHVALAYDLLYDDLTEEQRANTVKLIERHIIRPYEGFCKGGDFVRSLYAEPFNSHAYRMNQSTMSALTIYNESELSKKIVNFYYPIMANVLLPWVYQDGGSYQGPFYGLPIDYVTMAHFADNAGLAKFGSRAYFRNGLMSSLYLWPTNWVSSVGDAYNNKPSDAFQNKLITLFNSSQDYNENYKSYAKWMLRRILDGKTQYFYTSNPEFIPSNANEDVAEKGPAALPTARYFNDIGWIGMYSDLQDDNRVGMTFKSSWVGSYNHSHPDQNAFVIQGYGEELARDSDYYDYYHSAFDLAYNKQTFAHNAITYDDGVGQNYNDITAKGEITEFVNQSDFKLAAGEAGEAYSAGLSKAQRHIIYIHPETFIVIDDLATKSENPVSFEYWLNTKGDIAFYESKNGAVITNGNAKLEAQVHYPAKVEANYINYFAGTDLQEITPPSSAANETDKRLYFQTEKMTATKMVTTLDVHQTETQARYIKSENFGNYIKLSFEDGTIAYINITDEEVIQTKDDIAFSGRAFVYNADSMMLVDGVSAVVDGKEIIKSVSAVSVGFGKEEISVSSINKDAHITVNTGSQYTKLIKQYDDNLYDIAEGSGAHGVTWKNGESGTELLLYPGAYTLYTDKKTLAGQKGQGTLTLNLSGEEKTVPFEGVYDVHGNLTADYWGDEIAGTYVLEDISQISVRQAKKGGVIIVDSGTCMYLKGTNPYIKLTALGSNQTDIDVIDEPKEIESKVDVTTRATDYVSGGQGSTVVWWERITNNTLQNFNTKLGTITYTLEVPEDGKYDIVMSVSTVSNDVSDKVFHLGDAYGTFHIPATEVYSDLQAVRVKCQVELKAGMNELEFINADNGVCIFDWIGLMKSDK